MSKIILDNDWHVEPDIHSENFIYHTKCFKDVNSIIGFVCRVTKDVDYTKNCYSCKKLIPGDVFEKALFLFNE